MSLCRLIRSLASPAPAPGGFQFILGPGGVPRLRDPNGLVYRLRAEAGTAVNLPSTATLDPAGANNGIALEGDGFTGATIDEGFADSAVLNALASIGTIIIGAGNKHRMLVTTNFGSGQETISLSYVSTDLWTTDGLAYAPLTAQGGLRYDAGLELWVIYRNDAIGGFAPKTGSFPDLETWNENSSQGGVTPIVTAARPTAAQAIAAINAAALGVTASNAPGNDGTGAIAAATASFTPGGPLTEGQPGDLLYDESNLYLLTSTGWKTIPIP